MIVFSTNETLKGPRVIVNLIEQVNTKVGNNNISVTMNGSTPDCYGFMLWKVSLYEEYSITIRTDLASAGVFRTFYTVFIMAFITLGIN